MSEGLDHPISQRRPLERLRRCRLVAVQGGDQPSRRIPFGRIFAGEPSLGIGSNPGAVGGRLIRDGGDVTVDVHSGTS